MALREIRLDTDPILRKRSREIDQINDNIKTLIEDMYETMYKAEGVGLAAPQVGVLRRLVVVDTREEGEKYTMINPEIISDEGENLGLEGCLSIPGYQGQVERPEKISVSYLDEEGQARTLEAEDFLARAICHEIDHLNGVLYTDRAVNLYEIKEEDQEDEQV